VVIILGDPQRAAHPEEGALKRRHPAARAWYGSKAPPDEGFLQQLEAADPAPQFLFDNTGGSQVGEGAELVKGLYDKMDSLKRNPLHFRTWTEEDGMETFFETLLDLTPSNLRARVQILQQVGGFKFRASATPEDVEPRLDLVQPLGQSGLGQVLGLQTVHFQGHAV